MESRPRPRSSGKGTRKNGKNHRTPQNVNIPVHPPTPSTSSTLDLVSDTAMNLINPLYSMITTEANIVGHVLYGLGTNTAGMFSGMNLDLIRNRFRITNQSRSKPLPDISIDDVDDSMPIDQRSTPTLHQGFKNRNSLFSNPSEHIEHDLESLYSEGSKENAMTDLTIDQIKSKLDRISYLKTKYSHKAEIIDQEINALNLKKDKLQSKLNNLDEKEQDLINMRKYIEDVKHDTIIELESENDTTNTQIINDPDLEPLPEESIESINNIQSTEPEVPKSEPENTEAQPIEITEASEPINEENNVISNESNCIDSEEQVDITNATEEVTVTEDISLPDESLDTPIIPRFGSFLKSFEPHPKHSITTLDINPQNRYIVTGSTDSTIKLFDYDTEESLATLLGQNGSVHCLKSDYGLVVSGGQDTNIYIHNINNVSNDSRSELVNPLMTLSNHSSSVSAIDFNQTTLISGSSDGTMIHWDLETGKSVSVFDTVWNMNTGLVKDYKTKYWNTINGRGSDYESLDTTVGSLMVWKYALASGTIDGVIRMWDIRTGQSHRSLSDHLGPITSLQFDQTTIVSSSLDKTIRIWDLRMGKVIEKLSLNHPALKVQFDKQMIVGIVDEYEAPYVYNRVTFQPQQLANVPVNTTIEDNDKFVARLSGVENVEEGIPTGYFSATFIPSNSNNSVGWLAGGTRTGQVNIWSI